MLGHNYAVASSQRSMHISRKNIDGYACTHVCPCGPSGSHKLVWGGRACIAMAYNAVHNSCIPVYMPTHESIITPVCVSLYIALALVHKTRKITEPPKRLLYLFYIFKDREQQISTSQRRT